MRTIPTILAAAMLAAGPAAAQQAGPLQPGESWELLAYDVLGETVPAPAGELFEVVAPYRAEDAATVPVAIRQADAAAPRIESATIVIDENPAPVAAEFAFGPAMHPLDLEVRVRVDQYSNVRVIARSRGESFMGGRFVKASGSCSAPATRDPAEARATMGQMRLRLFDGGDGDSGGAMSAAPGTRREAQVALRHPNYSGLQRDPITHLFVPAHFVDAVEVRQGGAVLFSMEGGISISENPTFRFRYTDDGSPELTVRATDTDGNVFERALPKRADG